jgi:hypothetical protein
VEVYSLLGSHKRVVREKSVVFRGTALHRKSGGCSRAVVGAVGPPRQRNCCAVGDRISSWEKDNALAVLWSLYHCLEEKEFGMRRCGVHGLRLIRGQLCGMFSFRYCPHIALEQKGLVHVLSTWPDYSTNSGVHPMRMILKVRLSKMRLVTIS